MAVFLRPKTWTVGIGSFGCLKLKKINQILLLSPNISKIKIQALLIIYLRCHCESSATEKEEVESHVHRIASSINYVVFYSRILADCLFYLCLYIFY